MNEVRDVNHIPQIVAAFKGFANTEVEIGIFGTNAEAPVGESKINVLQLAIIQHEGSHNIPCDTVTDKGRKVRGYLAAHGLFLTAGKQFINIPARPFFDPVVDSREASEFVFEALRKGIESAGPGDMAAAERTFSRIGLGLETKIKKSMRDLRTPPNHPFTIKMKKSSNPLIDTGFLMQHFTHEVRPASGKG